MTGRSILEQRTFALAGVAQAARESEARASSAAALVPPFSWAPLRDIIDLLALREQNPGLEKTRTLCDDLLRRVSGN